MSPYLNEKDVWSCLEKDGIDTDSERMKTFAMKRQNKYILKLLLLVGLGLTACVKNVVPPPDTEAGNEDPVFNEGFSLEFLASLDDWGDNLAQPIDNYIDVEKFRVLFFTDDLDDTLEEYKKNVFLFESRTRFVRKHNGSSMWRVSVPLFNYGNGVAAKWNWDELRKFFREHPFKIAILANRPESEWSMRIVGKTIPPTSTNKNWSDNENDVIVPGSWYDNSAPHWDAINTLHGPSDGKSGSTQWKTLLDLHHVQYDPIYFGKSFDVAHYPSNASNQDELLLNDEAPNPNPGRGKYYHEQNKIYDFVA